MRNLALIVLFGTLTSVSAHAGIYLEPYVGYAIGKSSGSVNATPGGQSTIDSSSKGAVFGGKLGYSVLGLALGFDYSRFNSKDKDNTLGTESSSVSTDMGGFIQYTLPIMFKVSATYIFKSSNVADDDSKSTGKGFKIGVGFTGLPFVAINLDYISIKQNEASAPGFTLDSVDVKSTATMLSISVPFNF